ncbi:hypothetical protein BDQ17DRAFT_1344310 [Cyathus striatus]|nr:hypothetical protein BDQ17DRAFT_1344310 [Cyathus striatus]
MPDVTEVETTDIMEVDVLDKANAVGDNTIIAGYVSSNITDVSILKSSKLPNVDAAWMGCDILFSIKPHTCQTADWPRHKQECPALQRWAEAAKSSAESSSTSSTSPEIPSDAIRCLGACFGRSAKLAQKSKEIDALQSNRTSISKSLDAQNSQLHAHLAHAVDMADYGLHSASDLVDLVSRFTTNTFTVTTPTLTPIGACVSPLVALINHSCDPNASVVFPREPLLQVVALKPIEAGEEVLTSYIDTTLPKHLRQQVLRETYHFICRCSLCAHLPEPVDLRDAMYCTKKCGGLCRLPAEEDPLTRCTRCKSAVKDTDAVLDATRVGDEALKKAERVQFSDPDKARQLTTNLIPILTSVGVVPSAHPLLALSRLHTSLLISKLSELNIEEIRSPQLEQQLGQSVFGSGKTSGEAQEELDNCVRSATRTCTGLSQILPFGHPVRALAVTELGKLLTRRIQSPSPSCPSPVPGLPSSAVAANSAIYPPSGPARLKMAYQTLVRAREELMIGFGGMNEGGEVGKDIRLQIVDIEKELDVWRIRGKEAAEDELKRGKKL